MKLLIPTFAFLLCLSACSSDSQTNDDATNSSTQGGNSLIIFTPSLEEVTEGQENIPIVPQAQPENSPADDSQDQDSETEQSTEDAEPEVIEEAETQAEEVVYLSFVSQNIYGEPISSALLAEYDLTVVNIWATWCGPCVMEMPYLQEVYALLPDKVNLITICHDGDSQTALAQEILAQSAANFHTVIPDQQIQTNLMPLIRAFPTTLFVNAQGVLLAAVEGVPSGDVVSSYLDMINQVYSNLL